MLISDRRDSLRSVMGGDAMGGGGGGTPAPSDALGGQFASFSGGTPAPFYQQPSFYQNLGSGLSSLGAAGIGSGTTYQAPNLSPALPTIPIQSGQVESGLIPVPQAQQPDILAALMRLLQGIQ